MKRPTPTQRSRLGILKELTRKRRRGGWERVERYRRRMERKRQRRQQCHRSAREIDETP